MPGKKGGDKGKVGISLSGSRLSAGVKKSIMQAKKSGSLTGKQARAMRSSLRAAPARFDIGKKMARAAGLSRSDIANQRARSTARAAVPVTPKDTHTTTSDNKTKPSKGNY